MYEAENFDHLLGTPGFSDALLTNHFTLYQGYVKNTNTLIQLLGTIETGTPEHSELVRRFGWEWNGMRLHELYFGNMKKTSGELADGALKQMIEKIYGDLESWKKKFVGVGAMRGIGWVVLAHDHHKQELFTHWVGEHDIGHLSGTTPLLIMDVFEHAFMLDYGLKRADYISAFWNAIDWKIVEKRYDLGGQKTA